MTRAYLFAHGQVLLNNMPGESSGGPVDTGLQSFFSAYWVLPFHQERAITKKEVIEARELAWERKTVFRGAPGTASYFPLIYLPQATAIRLGKWFGLGVESTYYLARVATLLIALCFITLGFHADPPSPAVCAVMCFPMMLFQFAATSIDGLTTGISVAIISAYSAMHKRKSNASRLLLAFMSLGVWIVVSCRPYLLPMALLVATPPARRHRRFGIALAGIIVMVLVGWYGLTVAATVDRRPRGLLNAESNIRLLCREPWLLLDSVYSTLTDFGWVRKTVGSFFGYLGWLDTPLPAWSYIILLSLFLTLVWVSIAGRSELVKEVRWRSSLLCIGVGSLILVFFMSALAFDIGSSRVLTSIQGRYFTIPVLMILYAISSSDNTTSRSRRLMRLLCLVGICVTSLCVSVPTIVARYYLH